MRRNIGNEVNKLFKEMGLEEEVKKLTGLFTDTFMIKGEETEDLKEALRRAPDSLIDLIWEKITGEESDTGTSRQQKEESLYEDIPEYFESRFELLDIAKINLLVQVMNYYPIDVIESADVMNEFVPFGWVFAFAVGQGSSFAVMKELKDIIMTLEKPEVKERVLFMNGIRYVVNACLGLYGVCTMEQIRNVFLKSMDGGSENREEVGHIDEIVQEYLPYLEEQKVLWLDGKYIISPYLKTEKVYKELLRRQKKNYYVPDDEMIKNYGAGKMLVKNEEYEAVFKFLAREIKDQDQAEEMLEELSGYVIREDWEVSEIMDCLYDWDVTFSSEKAAEKLIGMLSKWLYSIRRWSECGYSRKELRKENTDLNFITYANKNKTAGETAKKVYPNDPCPCGSGKKYKKCCGRK